MICCLSLTEYKKSWLVHSTSLETRGWEEAESSRVLHDERVLKNLTWAVWVKEEIMGVISKKLSSQPDCTVIGVISKRMKVHAPSMDLQLKRKNLESLVELYP